MQFYQCIGAGGTGSVLLPLLLRYLDHYHANRGSDFDLTLIDGDQVESKNLERQMFDESDVQDMKAAATIARLGHNKASAVNQYLGTENISLLADGDIVFIAADNYKVRLLIEQRGLELDNFTVINGGNERTDGSLQIWVRRDGENITPPLSFMHPELLTDEKGRDEMSCEELHDIAGGEQTFAANVMSAAQMLNALTQVHAMDEASIAGEYPLVWHEQHFDLLSGKARAYDYRKAYAAGLIEVAA